MEILEKKDNKIRFVIDKINPVIANTLRRVIMTEVPVMAIKEINAVKNNSGLYDEIIAHRLGLVPMKTDLKVYNLPEECKCKGKGCALCRVNMTIDLKGPCTVYSKDIKSDDPKVKPVYDNMPITKLNTKNHSLKLEAIATLGIGKEHAKYSLGLVYYQAYPVIKVGSLKNPEECEKICPTNVFELKAGKLNVKNLEKCNLCKSCVDHADPEESIEVKGNKEKFIFTLETWGQLDAKVLFKEAFKIIDKNLDEFSKEVKKINK